MILVAGVLYLFLEVLDAGVFGALVAFILSRPGRLVRARTLALVVLGFVVLYDLMMYAIVAPLDLTLTTGNPQVASLVGSSDLSDVFQPSFGVIDIVFYILDMLVGTCFGEFVVRRYFRKHNWDGIRHSHSGSTPDIGRIDHEPN